MNIGNFHKQTEKTMKVNGNPDWTETEAGQKLQERLSSEKTLEQTL